MNNLLDMSMGQQNPMLNVAQASRPQMMPNAPSAAAGLMYGQDDMRHRGMVDQAAGLAQLQAQMQAQQAEEMSAARPGRMAEIEAMNTEAGGRRDAAPGKAKNMVGAEQVKAIQQEIAKLEPYLNSWDKAKTPEEKAQLQEMMQSDGAKFGKMDLGSLPPDKLDMVMKGLRHAQANAPKMNIEEQKIAGKEKVAGIQADAKITATKLHNDAMIEAKKLGIQNAGQAKTEWERLQRKSVTEEGLTPEEAQLFETLVKVKIYSGLVRENIDPGKVGIEDGKITRTKPPATGVPSAPKGKKPNSPSAAMSLDDYLKEKGL